MDYFSIFVSLSQTFAQHGYNLYLVGGSSRDYLLNLPLSDMDLVSDASPSQMSEFLIDADYTFSRFGSVKLHYQGVKFDITTLREEQNYLDSRHPTLIKFVKRLDIDVKRRDFTINALYIDEKGTVYDYVEGQKDLKNKIIRMIGNPSIRLKEDPLRIIRAIRFSLDYNFQIDEQLSICMMENIDLLNLLNKDKIKQDIKKIKCQDKEKINKIFIKFHIKHLLDMVE